MFKTWIIFTVWILGIWAEKSLKFNVFPHRVAIGWNKPLKVHLYLLSWETNDQHAVVCALVPVSVVDFVSSLYVFIFLDFLTSHVFTLSLVSVGTKQIHQTKNPTGSKSRDHLFINFCC